MTATPKVACLFTAHIYVTLDAELPKRYVLYFPTTSDSQSGTILKTFTFKPYRYPYASRSPYFPQTPFTPHLRLNDILTRSPRNIHTSVVEVERTDNPYRRPIPKCNECV